MLQVLLASPMPPPYGGITNWTNIILDQLKRDNTIQVLPVDISLKKSSNERSVIGDTKTQLKIWHRARVILTEARHSTGCHSVLHICTSGGKGLIRDIVLIRLARRRGIPSIIHFHYGRVPDTIDSHSLEGCLLRSSLSQVSACVAMDRKTLEALNAKGFKDKTYLIPNPISREITRPIDGQRNNNQFVFVGHVEKLKGIEDLLSAWESLEPEGLGSQDVQLKIIGPINAEYRKQLESRYLLNRVIFLGSMNHSDVLKEVSRSRCLVLPSYTEGFPNVILEAFALEVPVVASSVGAIPEMLSGNSGILIHPGDIAGLTNAISSILTGGVDLDQVVRNARQKIDSKYSADVVKKELVNCWMQTSAKTAGV